MATPFTPAQLILLQELAARGQQSRYMLMRATSTGSRTFQKVYESLEYRGLVTEGDPITGRSSYTVEITMAGRRALHDLERGEYLTAQRVPPPTRNLLQGIYRPPVGTFYRNNGNAHIPSRGVAC